MARFHPAPWILAAGVVPAALVAPAYATQYLNTEQAQHALFPQAEKFAPVILKLSSEQKETIEKLSGVRVRKTELPVWQVNGPDGAQGWFIVDEVLGKHEFITYAVALDASGAVQGIEIMDYRETHGGEVRNAGWRAQFHGKRHGAALKLDEDVRNISGATLSCKHMADGVKRLLAAYHVALRAK